MDHHPHVRGNPFYTEYELSMARAPFGLQRCARLRDGRTAGSALCAL